MLKSEFRLEFGIIQEQSVKGVTLQGWVRHNVGTYLSKIDAGLEVAYNGASVVVVP